MLHARDARRGQLVVACCPRARKQGVQPGMPLAEAATLSELQPSAVGPCHDASPTATVASRQPTTTMQFMEHEPECDRETLAHLAAWCEQFSPIVGLEPDDQPTCLLLDISGLAALFGGEPRIVDRIRKAFASRNYQVQLGIGDTVGAAWARAHFAAPHQANQDLLDFPVEALRLPSATLDLLQQLGIHSIKQLLQIPRKALVTRLGNQLLRRLDQLLGKEPEVIVAHHPPPEFEVHCQLEHPTHRRDALETILDQLAQQLAAQLKQHDHAVVQLEAILHGPRRSQPWVVSLFEPTNNPQHLLDLLKLQSERVQFRDPLHRIQLRATATVRIAAGQQLLWEDSHAHTAPSQQRTVGLLIDRLTSRLGKESVFGICAQAGALPEKSYREKQLTNTLRKSRKAAPPTLKAPHRPLWLFDPPHALNIAEPSKSRKGLKPPASFQFGQQNHQVTRHWGPERIETGWWNGKTVRRDYYRVETDTGSRFWIFRQLNNNSWYLHGSFE